MAEVRLDDLKPNSYASRESHAEPEPTEKRVNRVGTGRSARMRKSLRRRFVDIFFAEDVGDVKTYLVRDIVVPAIQDAIVDGVTGALGMIFYGDSRRVSNKTTGGPKINYGGYFGGGASRKNKVSEAQRKSAIHSGFEALMKDNRGEAEEILIEMEEILNDYGQITVSDYYDLFGESTEFTQNNYGWLDLDNARIRRVPRGFYDEETRRYIDGFAVEMPRPVAL